MASFANRISRCNKFCKSERSGRPIKQVEFEFLIRHFFRKLDYFLDADFLHEQCPMGSCLAVLNKHEVRQKAVLDMIFSSLSKKAVQGN